MTLTFGHNSHVRNIKLWNRYGTHATRYSELSRLTCSSLSMCGIHTYSAKMDLLLFVRDYSFHGFRLPDRRIILDNQEIHTGDTPSGQFLSASSFFPSKSFRQGAKNISPVAALFTVRTATIIQSNVTAMENIYLSLAQVSSEERQGTSHTVPKTLKKVDGNSLAI